jgi:sporulation protein YlmC with PRC-barrel domain
MMKFLTFGAVMSALIISGAFAQQSNAPGKPEVVTTQQPDQLLASKFKGTEVLGLDNKKIGEVKDLLFDKEGKILAYIVSAGGFLGMGSKDVALAPKTFQVIAGQDGGSEKLKITMSENDLKQAQNFQAYEPPRSSTTGSGATTSGGARPSTNSPSSR